VYDEEKIEQLYAQHENKPFSDLNISSHSHPIQMARDLGIHDKLLKKYNIWHKRNRNKTEEDYKKLLEIKTMKEARQKPYAAILQSLTLTKDENLIKKYTDHLDRLRPREYTDEMLKEFFDSLPTEVYPKSQRFEDYEHNKLYRALFHRGKEIWYDRILEKWGDKVPMDFLKDEDKLKRVKKFIDESTNYTEWYRKYSNHKRILKRLNSMYLLDSLEKSHNRNRNLTEIIKLAKPFNTRKEFFLSYPSDYAWVVSNNHDEIVFSHMTYANGWNKRIVL